MRSSNGAKVGGNAQLIFCTNAALTVRCQIRLRLCSVNKLKGARYT